MRRHRSCWCGTRRCGRDGRDRQRSRAFPGWQIDRRPHPVHRQTQPAHTAVQCCFRLKSSIDGLQHRRPECDWPGDTQAAASHFHRRSRPLRLATPTDDSRRRCARSARQDSSDASVDPAVLRRRVNRCSESIRRTAGCCCFARTARRERVNIGSRQTRFQAQDAPPAEAPPLRVCSFPIEPSAAGPEHRRIRRTLHRRMSRQSAPNLAPLAPNTRTVPTKNSSRDGFGGHFGCSADTQ